MLNVYGAYSVTGYKGKSKARYDIWDNNLLCTVCLHFMNIAHAFILTQLIVTLTVTQKRYAQL